MPVPLSAFLWSRAEAPPKTAARVPYDDGLEGLRGIAALSVVMHHVFCDGRLDDTYSLPEWMLYLHFAHAGVLLFFVLSGYVIGLTTRGEATPQAMKSYLQRRAIRILPIYVLALLLSVAVLGRVDWSEILHHLAFMQRHGTYFGLFTAYPIETNPALWSLHYEAFFYLGFLAVWLWKPRWGPLMGGAFVVGLTALIVDAPLALLWSLGCGSLFWLSGLWLSWNAPYQRAEVRPLSVVSMLLLLAASMHLSSGALGLSYLDLEHPSDAMVRLEDLVYFPLAVLLVGEVTRRQVPWRRFLIGVAYGIPLVSLGTILAIGHSIASDMRFIMAFTLYGLSLATWFVQWPVHRLRLFVYAGSISYGLYVVHMPLIALAAKVAPFNGTWWMHGAVAGVVITVSVVVSVLLERVMQPRVRQWLGPRTAAAATEVAAPAAEVPAAVREVRPREKVGGLGEKP